MIMIIVIISIIITKLKDNNRVFLPYLNIYNDLRIKFSVLSLHFKKILNFSR